MILRPILLGLAAASSSMAGLGAGAAAAQDMAPAISPEQAAQGIFYKSMANQAGRAARRPRGNRAGPSADAIAMCRMKARAPGIYGPNHWKTRRIFAICRQYGL